MGRIICECELLRPVKARKANPPPAKPLYSVFFLASCLLGCASLDPSTLHRSVQQHLIARWLCILLELMNSSSKPAERFPPASRGAGLGSQDYIFKGLQEQKDLYRCLMGFFVAPKLLTSVGLKWLWLCTNTCGTLRVPIRLYRLPSIAKGDFNSIQNMKH